MADETLATTNDAPWHGYSMDACQWLLAQPYRDLKDNKVCDKLFRDFMKGEAQLRLRLTAYNLEPGVPDIVYACKYKPKNGCYFMIRIDPATGKPFDIQEQPAPPTHGLASSMGQGQLIDLMADVFKHFAHWHCETFGVGPVAPTEDKTPGNLVANVEAWSKARRERIAEQVSEVSTGSVSLPRL